jgi:hypothetical protein
MGALVVLETAHEVLFPRGGRVGVALFISSDDRARGEGLHREVIGFFKISNSIS